MFNLPGESSIIDFFSPTQWWFFAPTKYKFIFIFLLILFFLFLTLLIFKKFSVPVFLFSVSIIIIAYYFMMFRLNSDATVFPFVLNFNSNEEKAYQQKEIFVVNKEGRPKYLLNILVDIDKLDFSQIKTSISSEYTITANEFNLESNDILSIFNVIHNNKKYLWITKRKHNGFSINISAAKGKIKIKEAKFSYDDPGIIFKESKEGMEFTGKVPDFSEFKSSNDRITIAGMNITLMKK